MRLLYMAAPYTHPNPLVQTVRKQHCNRWAASLTAMGAVFSPITHGTGLEPYLRKEQAQDHGFWMDQCLPILRASSELVLLPLKGYKESRGVWLELALARDARIPITVIQPLGESPELEEIDIDFFRRLDGRKPHVLWLHGHKGGQ